MSHRLSGPPSFPKRFLVLILIVLVLITMGTLGALGFLTAELLDIFMRVLRVATQLLSVDP